MGKTFRLYDPQVEHSSPWIDFPHKDFEITNGDQIVCTLPEKIVEEIYNYSHNGIEEHIELTIDVQKYFDNKKENK